MPKVEPCLRPNGQCGWAEIAKLHAESAKTRYRRKKATEKKVAAEYAAQAATLRAAQYPGGRGRQEVHRCQGARPPHVRAVPTPAGHPQGRCHGRGQHRLVDAHPSQHHSPSSSVTPKIHCRATAMGRHGSPPCFTAVWSIRQRPQVSQT